MDFFNSRDPAPPSNNPLDGLQTPFVQAVNERYASNAPSSLLTSRWTPGLALSSPIVPSSSSGHHPGKPAIPRLPPLPQGAILGPSVTATFPAIRPGAAPAVSSSASPFKPLLPDQLVSMLKSPDLLLIDIRPVKDFNVSRIPGAISLVVPSMLLKRPNYALTNMADSIQDPYSKSQFDKWRSAKTILVYDVDTSFLSDASNISGLLRKFQASGFKKDLHWLRDGFKAFAAAFSASVDGKALADPEGEPQNAADNTLRTRNLSTHAFLHTSTTILGGLTPRGSDRIQTSSLSAANPFYDNIRQNRELSQGIDARIPLVLPPEVIACRNDLPFKWLRDIVDQAETDEGDALARQFYRIELGEQRRLQGVMDHHSQESSSNTVVRNHAVKSDGAFPYSITAGIEMGAKNRYRNIWPYEHARVRLQKAVREGGSDYVNASFVQSIVSPRRYIATQGPLDSTFNDFWSICWEQSVPVIVMLTREMESSQRKCGNYWGDGRYGDFEIKLLKQEGAAEVTKPTDQSGSFYHFPKAHDSYLDSIVERTIQLTNRSLPHHPSRTITHLQYLEWSDMDVPSSPAGLLSLIKRVDQAVVRNSPKGKNQLPPPILLHCSAGVGRTGGYILVDSVLAGVKHEMLRKGVTNGHHSKSSGAMEVDQPESVRSYGTYQRPDDYSSLSSPSVASGSKSSAVQSSVQSTNSGWSGEPTEPGPKSSLSSRLGSMKPRKLSHLVVDKLARETKVSTTAQITQWSKDVPGSSSSSFGASTYFGDYSTPSDEGTENDGPNYKSPRKYDPRSGSPPFPSVLSEPIQDILEDMREQRMSLCQSLRQYVFAHRAIIEGALEMVDEARATNPGATTEMAWSSSSSISSTSNTPSSPPTSNRAMAGRLSSSVSRSSSSGSTSSPPPNPRSMTGKRSASPKDGRSHKGQKRKYKNADEPETSPSKRVADTWRRRW